MDTTAGTSNSSISSEFKFLHYKVDFLRLVMRNNVELVKIYGQISNDAWDFNIGIRQPKFYVKDKLYLGGIEISLYFFNKDEQDKTQKNALISVESGIVGLFRFNDESKVNTEVEDNLVRYQIPFLLLPYLRAAITSLLATAGYGSVMFPLININALAKDALKDKPIVRVQDQPAK